MSAITRAGCAEQIIPDEVGTVLGTGLPQITPRLDGVGPSAVFDIGDVLETVTPLMVTSVGALISKIGTECLGG